MNVASIASAAVSFRAAESAAKVQFAVAAKALDQQRAAGDAVVQLLRSAQSNVDTSIANLAQAIGGALDIHA